MDGAVSCWIKLTTAECVAVIYTQFITQRLVELWTLYNISRRYSQNDEKPHIFAKLNIPPLTNDTQVAISIAKQHLHKFHH